MTTIYLVRYAGTEGTALCSGIIEACANMGIACDVMAKTMDDLSANGWKRKDKGKTRPEMATPPKTIKDLSEYTAEYHHPATDRRLFLSIEPLKVKGGV